MDHVQIMMLKKAYCFQDGWGDLSIADAVVRSLHDPAPPAELEIEWAEPVAVLGAELRAGTFTSPSSLVNGAVGTGRVWWLHPADRPLRGAVVSFASWAEEGPAMRGRVLGPLVRDGIAVLLMENPYYGYRRSEAQVDYGLRSVSDFLRMQGAAFEEGRALVRWMQNHLQVPVGVFGFSMGAHLGAAVANSMPGGTPLVITAPPLCPSEPFTEWPLSRCADWSALGPKESAGPQWVELMDMFDLRTLASPPNPRVVRAIGCARDGMVPPSHIQEIANHWGVSVRWLNVGHVGVVMLRSAVLRQAVREVMGVPKHRRFPWFASESLGSKQIV